MERRNGRILLVEDNTPDARLFQIALEEIASGAITVDSVANGAQALDYAFRRGKYTQAPEFNLVVLDLNLPGIDGFEVMKALKTERSLQAIPVVVLSTSGNPSDIARSYREGASAYLRKPVNADGMFTLIRRFVDYWFTVARLPEG